MPAIPTRLLRPALIILFALGLALISHTWRSDASGTDTLPEPWLSMTTAELEIIPPPRSEGSAGSAGSTMPDPAATTTTAGTPPSRWLTVRIADEADERAQGMQHLPARVVRDHPIWFVFAEPRRVGWHMQNVRAPLDIAYVDATGTVIGVQRMTPDTSGYGINAPIAAALEVAAGEAERLGITPGTRLRLSDRPPLGD